MKEAIDRLGDCPKCGSNWDNGDIYQYLAKLDVFVMKSAQEVIVEARKYGWTPENQKKLSRVIGIEVSDKLNFFQCPDCLTVFNSETGEKFETINAARVNYGEKEN